METAQQTPAAGSLSWKLSSHPITLLTFLFFRMSPLVVYLLGLKLLSSNFVLIFIVTMLLLAMDFYYLKNIAGRRLVGLRWWNEVDSTTGDGRWVFESAEPESRDQNATDKRFFWMALYVQPVLWVVLAIFALMGFKFIWLTLVGKFGIDGDNLGCRANRMAVIALVLTITNTLAFSRCDKFSQASGFASNAMYGSGLARNLAGGIVSNWFRR
ncbi:hypothetical protein DE146DRAFT_605998 [Phaeosphaeria sp. MPI-PUGE-AT-0046c]|nr:hypothetical protein DE146DRAFT_605998 [Phaeosphaeria sp. MPI-PUGE-AT-0046c]